jgi:hypothetical protein
MEQLRTREQALEDIAKEHKGRTMRIIRNPSYNLPSEFPRVDLEVQTAEMRTLYVVVDANASKDTNHDIWAAVYALVLAKEVIVNSGDQRTVRTYVECINARPQHLHPALVQFAAYESAGIKKREPAAATPRT